MADPRAPILSTSSNVADGIRFVSQRIGEPHAAFVDADWTAGPAGTVDLFGRFFTTTGQSLELQESIYFTANGVIAVYLIPARNVSAFIAFLDMLAVKVPDGRVVVPACSMPGAHEWAESVPASARQNLEVCHVIRPRIYPTDHPAVAELNGRCFDPTRN